MVDCLANPTGEFFVIKLIRLTRFCIFIFSCLPHLTPQSVDTSTVGGTDLLTSTDKFLASTKAKNPLAKSI